MKSPRLRNVFPIYLVCALAACGGGSGSGGASPTRGGGSGGSTPPTAVDRIVLTTIAPSEPAPAGTTPEFEFSIANPSFSAAQDVRLTVTFGQGMRLGSVQCTSKGDAACPANLDATNVPSLPAGGSLKFTIFGYVEAGATGTVPVSAEVTAANDEVLSNNSAELIASVYSTDISVAAATTKVDVVSGDAVPFTITVSNAGPDEARGVVLATSLGGRQSLTSIECMETGDATCPVMPTLDMTIPTLPSGGSLVFSLTTQLASDALASVSASMRAETPGDLNFANNQAASSAYVRIPTASSSPSFVIFQSDTGDSVGLGRDYAYDRLNAIFELEQYEESIALDISGNETWRAQFFKPSSHERWRAGTYTDVLGAPFHDPATGGLNVGGPGFGCDRSGWFKVLDVTYTEDELTAIDIIFAQHCDGRAPGLRGQIHWVANDGTLPPGPVNPPPSGLWMPAAGSTPTSGNYAYLESSAGEPIFEGGTRTFTQASAILSVSEAVGTLSVDIATDVGYSVGMRAMWPLTQIEAGYYTIDPQLPINNPVYPALSFSGNGRSCNAAIGGWFVIDSIAHYEGVLTALDARFEQRCGNSGGALRGQIHWRSDDPTHPPGPQVPPPAGLWMPPVDALPSAGNVVYLHGEPGNYQLDGTSLQYTPLDSIIFIGSDGTTNVGNRLHISVSGDEDWTGDFQAMSWLPDLVEGYYGNLEQFPDHNPTIGGIQWVRGTGICPNARGWFVVDDISYAGNLLESIELRFEQFCGTDSALHGYIRWSAADTRVPLPPQVPPPEDLWQPAHGTTPATGNYTYLVETPESVGRSWLYTQATAEFLMQISGTGLEIDVNGDERWDGRFAPMRPFTQLQPGFYDLPSGPTPARGAFNWTGSAFACALSTGWFVVDEVTYEASALRSLELRFERRCVANGSIMRGKIRWRYDDPTAAPGPVSPAPADLWAPPPGAVPVAGNVFYVEGEPGEFITDGEVYLITSALFQGGTGFDTYYVGAQQPGDMTWSIHLDSMNSIPRLEVGYYTNTQPTGSGNPSRGRMTISGRGLTCGQYGQGWFAIDDVTYDGEQMSSIDVRFEYRCGDDQPALRGKVRWSQ